MSEHPRSQRFYITTYGNPAAFASKFETPSSSGVFRIPSTDYEVSFTSDSIEISQTGISVDYSELCDIRHYKSKSRSEDEKLIYHRRNIIRFKTSDGGLVYLFRYNKDEEEERSLLRNKIVEAEFPSIPSEVIQILERKISSETVDGAPRFVLTEFLNSHSYQTQAKISVPELDSSESDIQISSETSGRSRGIQLGAFSRSKITTSSRARGTITTGISDQDCQVVLVFTDSIYIDSDSHEFMIPYSDIDLISDGRDMNIHTSTLSIKLRKPTDHPDVEDAVSYIKQRVRYFDQDSDDGSEIEEYDEIPEKIRELDSLYDEDMITKSEYETKKSELLEDF
jgi:hypothetical protein